MSNEVRTVNPTEKTCTWCGYKWEPRVKDPKRCPLCKQPLQTPSLLLARRQEREMNRLPTLEAMDPIDGVNIIRCKFCTMPAIVSIVSDGKKQRVCKNHTIEFAMHLVQPTEVETAIKIGKRMSESLNQQPVNESMS